MKKYLIKLLGGYTKEEMEITYHFMEDTSNILKNKIDRLRNDRTQLNQIFYHLSDALHNFSEKNTNPNYQFNEDFVHKMRVVFRYLRILAKYDPLHPDNNPSDYHALENDLF